MLDLFGNPEDRFSHNEAHISSFCIQSFQPQASSIYSNHPKFWDRQSIEDSADPDQITPRRSGSTLFAIPSAPFATKRPLFYSLRKHVYVTYSDFSRL